MRFIPDTSSVKHPGLLLAGTSGAILAFAYYLNSLVPLHSDDLIFKAGVESLADVFRLEYQQYMDWGGRSIVHILARLCLQLPLYIQDIINSLALLAVLGLAALAQQRYTFTRLSGALLFTFAFYICFHPALGQANFWIVGSANYLWPLILLGLQYHLLRGATRFRKSAPAVAACFLLGLVCGWSVEGQAAGCLLLSFCFLVANRRAAGKYWLYLAVLAGNLMGAAALFAAPGNRERMARSGFAEFGDGSFFDTLAVALLDKVPAIGYSLIAALATLVALYALAIDRQAFWRETRCLLIAGLGAAYVLSFAPYLAERALSPGFFLLLLAINAGIRHVQFDRRKIIGAVSGALLFAYSISVVAELASGYLNLNRQHKIRLAVIVQAIEDNRQLICTPDWHTDGIISSRLMYDGFSTDSKAPFYGAPNVRHLELGYDYSRQGYIAIYQALYRDEKPLCD